jgi:peroxiredoxin
MLLPVMTMMSIAVMLTWLAASCGCWFVYQLFRQNGRILLRLDALEQRLGETATAPTSTPGLPIGSAAPDFDLPDLSGARHTLSQFRGRRLLLIFFNPQCGYCVRMASRLAELAQHGEGKHPTLLIVSTGEREANRRLFHQHEIRCPVMLQDKTEVASKYQAHGTPSGYLIDEQGKIASELAMGAEPLLSLASGNAPPVRGNKSLAQTRLNRTGLKAGTPAPRFRLPRLDGGEISLEDYRGRRVLIVFSDPQCGPCDELAPQLERLHREQRDVDLVMISRRDAEANRQKVAKLGLTFPVALQSNWEISLLYGMFAAPIGYLIDEHGIIATEVATGVQPILNLLVAPQTNEQIASATEETALN